MYRFSQTVFLLHIFDICVLPKSEYVSIHKLELKGCNKHLSEFKTMRELSTRVETFLRNASHTKKNLQSSVLQGAKLYCSHVISNHTILRIFKYLHIIK